MVKRHYQIDFASGALVFPGGKTDKDDSNPGWDELTDGDFGPVQQDARIAAVREAFEESGILLARPRSARGLRAPLVGRETADSLAPYRGAVDRREARFIDLIARNGLVLALDSLIHFGHWITPVMMPKRFDTHFYLAPAPADQIAASDGRETTDAIWLNAAGALDREARGEASIIFPTRMNLRKLSEAETVEDAISRFSNASVVTVEPRAGKNAEGQPCLFIPEEAGYGVTEELLSNVRV
jgi:8-oxo-dGTP pyrophosphatase MutT (NUDIX family)